MALKINKKMQGILEAKKKTKYTVLIVDDEEINLRALRKVIKNDDFEVLEASNGKLAWEIIQALPESTVLHIIISDQRMPELSGVEFLERSISIFPNAIRILLTGYTDVETVIQSINKANIYKFITKPYDPGDIKLTLKQAVENYELRDIKKALEKEKELNSLKSNFTSMISHQFKTPISNVKTSVELMEFKLQNMETKLQDYFSKHFESIHEEIEIMNILVEDILTYGKVEKRSVAPVVESISFVDYCKFILSNRFGDKLYNQHIELQVFGYPQKVELDTKLMEHILFNLLSNAIKYSDSSPILRVRFQKQKLTILIADKGIGIPKKEQKNIFNSYYRAKNAENHQGTGLGLAITKNFVELHKGKIRFKSKTNKGSVFKITLPNSQNKQGLI